MKTLSIDPGTDKSGVVLTIDGKVDSHGLYSNEDILEMLQGTWIDLVLIEDFVSYGMPIGKTSIETIKFIGRINQVCDDIRTPYEMITRREVKHHLCNSVKAKDANVRQAILDRFDASGGGKTPQIGTKKAPGPLYGVSGHAWSALALYVYWSEKNKEI